MADDQQKKASPAPLTSVPSTPTPVQQQPQQASPAKGPPISRRAFLIGIVGVSTLLTIASVAQSGAILGPLIPPAKNPTVIASATDLESKYQYALASNGLSSALATLPNGLPQNPKAYFSQFFYWPYDISVSPYYKNIVVRLPDDKYLQQQPTTTEQWLGNTYGSSIYNSPTGGRFVAFNTTCVHLRCLVNPGYDPASGQFRLQCPCHGSQYNLADAVPVQGPAFDLGLNPLPKIELKIDASGNITATNLIGQPGIGRTTQ